MTEMLRPTSFKRALFFMSADLLISAFTLYFAYVLRFNFSIPENFLGSFWMVFVVIVSLKIALGYYTKLYFSVWRFFGFYEAKKIFKIHVAAYAVLAVVYLVFSGIFNPFPRSVIIIDFFLSLIFVIGLRALKRLSLEGRQKVDFRPTLVVGTGNRAATIIQSALKGDIDYYPQAIVSMKKREDDKHAYISNIKIIDMHDLERVIREKSIKAAIIAEEMAPIALQELAVRLNQAGVYEIKQVKLLGAQHEKLEDLSIEDLLARHPKDLDTEAIRSFVRGKKVLITGAGGSIGSEIARQCQRLGVSRLVLVDNSEYNLYQIGEQITEAKLRLANVTEAEAIRKIFLQEKPELVIHAAAYKHVPLCESNQEAAVQNNVLGSKNVMDVSIVSGVKKVVIVSTDKAVRPTNVMGATKRVIELYAQNVPSKETEIVAVRFGNVLGSSGSVIPKFKRQIEQGGPVTVTHPEINRYFMLIPEACQLVLQAAAIARGGELFVLDMGEPIKIVDLARQMIRLYGKEKEIEIQITGLRPGEKLYEELLIDANDKQTQYRSIFVARPTHYDISQLLHDIALLLEAENKIEILQKMVPEFTHKTVV